MSNIRSSVKYFHPEVQEIWPFKDKLKTLFSADAKVIAKAVPVLSYRLAKTFAWHSKG